MILDAADHREVAVSATVLAPEADATPEGPTQRAIRPRQLLRSRVVGLGVVSNGTSLLPSGRTERPAILSVSIAAGVAARTDATAFAALCTSGGSKCWCGQWV